MNSHVAPFSLTKEEKKKNKSYQAYMTLQVARPVSVQMLQLA